MREETWRLWSSARRASSSTEQKIQPSLHQSFIRCFQFNSPICMKNRDGWKHEKPNGTKPSGCCHHMLYYCTSTQKRCGVLGNRQETRRLQNENNVETLRSLWSVGWVCVCVCVFVESGAWTFVNPFEFSVFLLKKDQKHDQSPKRKLKGTQLNISDKRFTFFIM